MNKDKIMEQKMSDNPLNFLIPVSESMKKRFWKKYDERYAIFYFNAVNLTETIWDLIEYCVPRFQHLTNEEAEELRQRLSKWYKKVDFTLINNQDE